MIKQIATALFLWLLFPAFSQAQSNVALDTFQVNALRVAIPLHKTGRDVQVLEAKDIQHLPAATIDELLRYVPGLETQSRGAFGVQSDFSIQGATFSQVLVLIDGMRINDPLTGHFNSNIPVNPKDIARIEILKGPAAAVYGADAMGGVIHIHTKLATPLTKGFATDLEGKAGGYGLWSTTNYLQYRGKQWQATASAMHHSADGAPLPSGDSSWMNINTFSVGAQVQMNSRQTLRYRASYDYRDFNAKYFYTRSPFDESEETVTAWWQQLAWEHRGKQSTTTVALAHKWNHDVFLFNPAFGNANEHTTQLVNGQLNHQQRINKQWRWGVGAQTTYRTIISNDRGHHQEWHGGAYGLATYQGGAHWQVNGSARIDYDENYGIEMTPQISMAYWQPRWLLRANIGRSIRAADFTERFISTQLPGPLSSGRNLGNPSLSAETGWHAEGGGQVQLTRGVSFRATGFYRYGTNVIDYVETPATAIPTANNLDPNGSYLYARNIATVNTAGLDAALQWQATFGAWQLNQSVGYLFTDINTDEPVNAKYLTGQARHLVNYMGTLVHKRGSIGVTGLYKVRQPEEAPAIDAFLDDRYTVWHLQAQWWVWPGKVALTGNIQNVFNATYQDILGAYMPGRWWQAGVRWRMK